MTETDVIKEFIEQNYRLSPSHRLVLRKAVRKIVRQQMFDYENFVFGQAPFDPDVVGNIFGIEFKEAPLGENISAELKPHPESTFKFLAIINSDIDNDQHKRFSKFHEISHVMHNIFDEDLQAFRTPKHSYSQAYLFKDPREIICDITASEMLFYYSVFRQELDALNMKQRLSEQVLKICNKYNASIEATSRTLVENYPCKAFMMMVKKGLRREEEELLKNNPQLVCFKKPVEKPRIQYAIINQHIKFYIPRNKSFEENTIVSRALCNCSNEDDIVNLGNLGCGEGVYSACVLPEDDRCFFVGLGLE